MANNATTSLPLPIPTKAKDFSSFLKPKTHPSIVRYISGVHMGLSFKGLRKIASKLKLNLDALDSGEFVLFMNSKRTAFKLLAPNNVMVYYRHPKEHAIDPRVISLIPKIFDGKELNMDAGLKEVIQKDFEKYGKRH